MEDREKIKKYLKKIGIPLSKKNIDDFIEHLDAARQRAFEMSKSDISEEEYIKEARSWGISEKEIQERIKEYKEDLEMGLYIPLGIFNIAD